MASQSAVNVLQELVSAATLLEAVLVIYAAGGAGVAKAHVQGAIATSACQRLCLNSVHMTLSSYMYLSSRILARSTRYESRLMDEYRYELVRKI